MSEDLTVAERRAMEHAVAWRHRHRLYRNYFVAGPDHSDWPMLLALCERGLMRIRLQRDGMFGGQTVFAVTDAGMMVLEDAEKRERRA